MKIQRMIRASVSKYTYGIGSYSQVIDFDKVTSWIQSRIITYTSTQIIL